VLLRAVEEDHHFLLQLQRGARGARGGGAEMLDEGFAVGVGARHVATEHAELGLA